MNTQRDLLQHVLHCLDTTEASIATIAEGSGVGYDTVLRIKKGDHDPGYSKVRALGDYFDGLEDEKPKPAKAEVKAAAKPKPKRKPNGAHSAR